METKRCTHCGETKPLDQFRAYYNGRNGHYRNCKTCEKINIRYRYLVGKGAAALPHELEEIHKIERLYEARHAKGLETPMHRGERGGASALIDELLAKMESGNESM